MAKAKEGKQGRGIGIVLAMTAALLVLIILLCLLLAVKLGEEKVYRSFEPDRESYGNPLMGYAPRAERSSLREDVELVYVDITWRELEYEKGVYDFEEIAKDNQLDRWRQEGKHVVLRFVCDEPSDESARDIPDWLYEETGKDGKWYDISYGKGYAPNYNNPVFIETHARAIKALGEEYGQDTFVSYVELGSLGHWGEWHVKYDEDLPGMPMEDVRELYIQPYVEAFPNAKLLMRRPFNPAKEYGFGVYNDMAGHVEETERWFEWIELGGEFTQTDEENALAAMPDFWKTAPAGGELTSSIPMEQMLTTDLVQTVDLVRRSHTTFLGPKGGDAAYEEGYTELLRNIGYRYWISEAEMAAKGSDTQLTLTWENSGVAPMYWNWPVYAYVLTEQGEVVEAVPVAIQLTELLPGQKIHTSVMLETGGLLSEDHSHYAVGVGIADPMIGKCAVRLDMKARQQYGMTILFD